jgi:hypothetical protein
MIRDVVTADQAGDKIRAWNLQHLSTRPILADMLADAGFFQYIKTEIDVVYGDIRYRLASFVL